MAQDPRFQADELRIAFQLHVLQLTTSLSAKTVATTVTVSKKEAVSGISASKSAGASAPSVPTAVSAPSVPTDDAETRETHEHLLQLLRSAGALFDLFEHAPTRTSEESAKVRGVPLASGSKAMLLKAGKTLAHGSPYVLAVMSAVRTVDWPKIRALLESPKLSMASIDDVKRITGCIPGAVPPFGSLFHGVRTLIDKSLLEQGPEINFNAGLRTVSVLHLPVDKYVTMETAAGGAVADFTTASPSP